MTPQTEKLVNDLCKMFEVFIEPMDEKDQIEAEDISSRLSSTFPPMIRVDFIAGSISTLLHFLDKDSPTETRFYAAIYGSSLGRAIAAGKIQIID